jgi:nucleoside-diphosphate-sugar epimerase
VINVTLPSGLILGENQHWAVIGASGWIGSTIIELAINNNIQVTAFGSRESLRKIGGRQIHIHKYETKLLWNRYFDVVWDAAFVTQERLLTNPALSIVNEELTRRICQVAEQNTGSTVIYFSSGAAVHDPLKNEIYGLQKKQAESRLLEIKSKVGTNIKIIRVWNISGRNCPKPEAFALTSMLVEALSNNSITIQSKIHRWRRYAQITQVLYSALLFDAKKNILDTGGPIVELRDIAENIQSAINKPLTIIDERISQEKENYFSESVEYELTLEKAGIIGANLIDQIRFLL